MKISSEQEMLSFGKEYGSTITAPLVIELLGDVGAGKTTFTRGLAKGLGAKASVTSPSFTISKTYALPNNKTLIHYDFYRLKDPGIMLEDLEENLKNNHNIIIVEWGNSVAGILPENRIIIEIQKTTNGREILIKNNTKTTTKKQVAPTHSIKNQNSTNTITKPTQKSKDNKVSLYLDTSTPTTILKLNDKTYEWDSGRNLAEKLLSFIHEKLIENSKDWPDIKDITFMSGPGSFTGLRIGAAVVNTLASELSIPLYNRHGKKVKIILPDYGRDANIGKPRK